MYNTVSLAVSLPLVHIEGLRLSGMCDRRLCTWNDQEWPHIAQELSHRSDSNPLPAFLKSFQGVEQSDVCVRHFANASLEREIHRSPRWMNGQDRTLSQVSMPALLVLGTWFQPGRINFNLGFS